MKRVLQASWFAFFVIFSASDHAQTAANASLQRDAGPPYLGFDRNDYPGDAALPALRKTFRYTSYWLNSPPGETANSWAGKREILKRNGFGFLVLFTGRTDAQIKAVVAKGENAERLGAQDGRAAVAEAAREGFPKDVLIFLDQEEGGRLLPEQAAYLFAWVDAVRAGGARAGVYCSGIPVAEGSGTVTTAQDILEKENARSKGGPAHRVVLWIANDQCPPAPGCAMTAPRLEAGVPENLRPFATVWQFAQSPRRAQFSASCPQNQATNGRCYAPGLTANAGVFVDLDTADSADPSESSF